MVHVAEYKKRIVKDLTDTINQSHIIGAINVENLPAPQLQRMRGQMRDSVKIMMAKRRLIMLALEEAKKTKRGIEELEKYLEGMPALVFTKENPFKLFKLLQKNKSPAPAKAGQKAPKDLIVPKGPTSFAPGPIISELAGIGIKAGVDRGKVAVKEDSVVAKKGEAIKPKVADVLVKLGIEPMEVGLDLIAVYEDGIIYDKDILAVDETEFMNKLDNAARYSFNLAMFIGYPTKDTIGYLIGKAFNDAKAIGLAQDIIDEGVIDLLLGKANQQMLSLKSAANIEVTEKKVEKRGERKAEVEKEEAKAEEKPKKEKKKEPEKEKKIIEEEKKILEEEKELEKQEPKKIEAPIEKEVRKAVKEEEEKQLERERIEKEKELEKIDKEKKEELPSVEKLVKQTKDFAAGKKEPTADELLRDVSKKEEKKPAKAEKKEEVPSAAELVAKKKREEMENAAGLLKKLQKKGTLRD